MENIEFDLNFSSESYGKSPAVVLSGKICRTTTRVFFKGTSLTIVLFCTAVDSGRDPLKEPWRVHEFVDSLLDLLGLRELCPVVCVIHVFVQLVSTTVQLVGVNLQRSSCFEAAAGCRSCSSSFVCTVIDWLPAVVVTTTTSLRLLQGSCGSKAS